MTSPYTLSQQTLLLETQEQSRFQYYLGLHSQHLVNSVTLIWSFLVSP